jgi:hypothetical protein
LGVPPRAFSNFLSGAWAGRLVDGSRVEALLAANVPPQRRALWLRAQPDRVHGFDAAVVRVEIDSAIAVEVQA